MDMTGVYRSMAESGSGYRKIIHFIAKRVDPTTVRINHIFELGVGAWWYVVAPPWWQVLASTFEFQPNEINHVDEL